MKMKNKVSIVTGGSRGIGKAVCEKLAQEGATVIIVNVNPESGAKVVDEFGQKGLVVKNVIADISNEEQITKMATMVMEEFGAIDILVNNAGITCDNLILRMKSGDWDQVMNVNLKGAFNCIKAVGRYMVKARYGKIINISSVVGLSGNAGQANYAAAKAGLIGLSKSVAREFASRNITVNVVAPGYIGTDMTAQLNHDAKKSFLSTIPLNRAGKPEDVANLVCFLGSDEASYITGQTLNVDGGMLMY